MSESVTIIRTRDASASKNMTNAYHKLRGCGVGGGGTILPNIGLGTEAPIGSYQDLEVLTIPENPVIFCIF